MSPRSVLLSLVPAAVAMTAFAQPELPGPPGPHPPTSRPGAIEIAVELPGELRVVALDADQVRSQLGRNIFYTIDAFIEAGFDTLSLTYEVECVREADVDACHVVMIDGHRNSPTHRWQLTRDGRAEPQGINRIMWSNARSLKFTYQAKSPSS